MNKSIYNQSVVLNTILFSNVVVKLSFMQRGRRSERNFKVSLLISTGSDVIIL